jgi:hypothetical protein
MTIDNWLTLCSIILVVIGGMFALVQWIASNKIKRAEFISQIIDKLRFDKDMVKTMYMVDYDYNWYNQDFHNSNDEIEFSIDKLLSYLSYICYLHATGNIKKEEFKILQYELNRACISPSVQSYLWNLHHFSEKNKTICTFEYLIKYGIDSKIISTQFLDIESQHYQKNLNF